MKKHIVAIFLVWLIVLGFTPATLAGQYEWQVVTDGQGNIHETLSIQDLETSLNTDGWNSSSGEGTLKLERVHKDWNQYSAEGNGLPIRAVVKDYLIFSTTTLSYDDQSSLFNELVSMADGDISIQSAGIIQQSSASEVNNLDQDPIATWHLTSEQSKDALAQNPVFFQAITFNGLAISLTILLFGVIGITIWYLTYIRRVNKLIEEEYSLSNIEKLLGNEEEEKENELK
ncbi:hypothetical protein ASZ90_019415 [hydrocarbon metagenome]|uniref:Uncharacterized protein n=1 Tax=hydrocarbon metagenome TaxID=938273 RepID=A0A0W8E4C3_9ZZZZ